MTDQPQPGSFADRVTGRRVNLVARARDGLAPVEYLDGSAGIVRRGKRHQEAAAKKVGKSLGALVLTVDIAIAGGRAIIFDRENGADLYADRLDQILTARGLDDLARAGLSGRLVYYEFPRFRDSDERELVELCADADLVVFDSQRMYLSDLGLEENANDDYAAFMAALVEPLFRAGIATLILDNTGHEDQRRGRGASAKGDLNETLFTLTAVDRFDIHNAGRLRLEITDSRFGDSGRWELELGGGVFGSWQRVDRTGDQNTEPSFRPTGLMERVSVFLENCSEPPTRRQITDAVTGKAKFVRLATDVLVREGYARGSRHEGVESIRPYREADDPHLTEAENGASASPSASLNGHHDRVPTASQQIPLNQAENPSASHRVPGASPSASHDRVPVAGSPYGEPPAASQPPETPDDIPF